MPTDHSFPLLSYPFLIKTHLRPTQSPEDLCVRLERAFTVEAMLRHECGPPPPTVLLLLHSRFAWDSCTLWPAGLGSQAHLSNYTRPQTPHPTVPRLKGDIVDREPFASLSSV